METNYCKNCAYFHQHFAFDNKKIFRVYCGHCTRTRVRRRLPDTAACDDFLPAPPDESAFVSKEYLSKELLQYLLQLDLLPQIHDAAN